MKDLHLKNVDLHMVGPVSPVAGAHAAPLVSKGLVLPVILVLVSPVSWHCPTDGLLESVCRSF